MSGPMVSFPYGPPITIEVTGALGLFPARMPALAGKFAAYDASGNLIGASGTGSDGPLRSDLGGVGGSALINETPVGIAGDGVTNDGPALAAKTLPIVFPRQTHYIATSQHIDVTMEMRPGTILRIADGAVVTPRGGFEAGVSDKIFQMVGSGRVDLRQAALWAAHPEWWGAVDPGDGSADWQPSITQGMVAHPRVRLQLRDYNISKTLFIGSHQSLEGQANLYEEAGTATRLLAARGDFLVVALGALEGTLPNSAAGAPTIRNMSIARQVYPLAGSVGLLVGFSRYAIAENVQSNVSETSFLVRDAVHPILSNCKAKCSATMPGTKWTGYDLDGTGALSAAGGNASAYLDFCSAEFNLTAAAVPNSVSLLLHGRETDTFVSKFECVGGAVGFLADGTASGGAPNLDIDIGEIRLDQTATTGVYVKNFGLKSHMKIGRLYVGPTSGRAYLQEGNAGPVDIDHAEFLMVSSSAVSAAAGTTTDAANISGDFSGSITAFVSECNGSALAVGNVIGSEIEIKVSNFTCTLQAIIKIVSGSTDNVFKASAVGADNKVNIGFQSLDPTNDYNEFHLTRLGRAVVVNKKAFAATAESHSLVYGITGSVSGA